MIFNVFHLFLWINKPKQNFFLAPDECGSSADEGQNSQCGTENETQANNLGVSENTTTATINCKEAAQVMQQTYLPNIPLRSSHTLEMDVFSEKTAGDTVVEKVGVVKYIGQDLSCESGNPQNRNCSTLSEKSSDSGVSSSSLSSSNHNATRNKQRRSGSKATLIESPTRSYVGHYISDRKDWSTFIICLLRKIYKNLWEARRIRSLKRHLF